MTEKSLLEKVAGALVLVSIAVVVSGTKACQENYRVGAQASLTPGAEPTATHTATSTVTSTPPPSVTATTEPETEGVSLDDSMPDSDDDSSGLLEELSVLDDKSADAEDSTATEGNGTQKMGNWLGKGLSNSSSGAPDGQWEDSDGDGFSNAREDGAGSDASDAGVVPADVERGELEARLRQGDQDMDGLANDDEAKRGTNAALSDTDGDGRADGAEVLSGSDPLEASAGYVDADNDSLSDTYEESRGLNMHSNDSDGDGLRDDIEVVVGSNPLRIDSDGDGISDGKEYDLGSDPLLGEPDKVS